MHLSISARQPGAKRAATAMLAALLIIPILTFLIFVHELGHYTMARRAGIKVEEFGFGLPPRLWGIQRGETLWSINWIPLGGFVRVLGEDGKNFSDRSMQSKTAGQRSLFLAAGSIMNFLTALVLIGVLIVAQGQPTSNVYITDVAEDSPAFTAGLQSGDQVLEVAGRSVSTTTEYRDATQDHLGETHPVVVLRDGEQLTFNVTARTDPPPNQGATGVTISDASRAEVVVDEVPEGSLAEQLGFQADDEIVSVGETQVIDSLSYELAVQRHRGETVDFTLRRDGEQMVMPVALPADLPEENAGTFGADMVAQIQFERPSLIRVVPLTFQQFIDYIRLMFDGLIMIINGEVPLSQIAGPIGMGQLTSEIVEHATVPGWVAVLTITIVLSLNLAILNLLPLPALDGGRLIFVLLEVLRRGRRVAPEKEGLVHLVGLVVLLTLMIAVAFIDIDRIISGQSFLQ
jgi:regulator of sigma E protease